MTDVPVTPADLAKALRPPRSQWRDVWDQFKTHKGALVGFASLVPGLIHDLLQAVKAGDLTRAMAIQAKIDPLKDAVYGAGEPTGEAHANMKAAMVAAGIFRNGTMRPPTVMPNKTELARIEAAVKNAGIVKSAAD